MKSSRALDGTVRGSSLRQPPVSTTILTVILILGKILTFSSSSHLRAEEPFFQDRATNLWLGTLRNLKSGCLVFKPYYASAALLLYKHIRLRRIPQLSALVASLQSNHERVSKRQLFSPPVRLGDCTQSLDLLFFMEYPLCIRSSHAPPNASGSHLIPFSTTPPDVILIRRAIHYRDRFPAPFSSPSRIRSATIPYVA